MMRVAVDGRLVDRQRLAVVDDRWPLAPDAGAGAPHPADKLALDQAMAGLPVEQRAAVALCLAGDFSHAEAAQILALPLGTVKSHVTRGRSRLLQALGLADDPA